MNMRKEQRLIVKICAVAMMAAIVFVGNYLRVKIPVSLGGTTSFTLANILCALAGLLLGPWWGGLAAGMGSAIYDMLDPEYIVEAPITFLTKGMYGLVAGLVLYYIFKNSREKYGPQVVATACEAAAGKPAPDIYLLVAERLGVAPEKCAVFEDVPAGIQAGKSAGMLVFAVEDDFSAEMRREKEELADYFIDDFYEILRNEDAAGLFANQP